MTHQLDAPAIGFRAFKWTGGALKSIGVEAEWPVQRGPQIASCKPHYYNMISPHEANLVPLESCTCGQYAYTEPKKAVGQIQAVVIGYGKLIVHPDGWRAEKAEIIGLIVPPRPKNHSPRPKNHSKCKHSKRGVVSATLQCEECGASLQQIELEATGGLYAPQSTPSLSALEILAEQYGARVIQNWEDGVALAQEQGAKPIPEELHAEARKNAPKGRRRHMNLLGGYLVPPVWTITTESLTITQEWMKRNEELFRQSSEALGASFSLGNALKKPIPKREKKKKQLPEAILRKREKREQHAKLWGPDTKAA